MAMNKGAPPSPPPMEETDPEIADFFKKLVGYQVEQKKKGKVSWFDVDKFSYEGVGRNDQCPCESGKKYKKCCMTSD